jgi:hypothetical protein
MSIRKALRDKRIDIDAQIDPCVSSDVATGTSAMGLILNKLLP